MARAKLYANAAERQAAYRARKGRQVVLYLPDDLAAELDEYLARRQMNADPDATRSTVIEHLLRQQLLRKR